MNDTAPANLDLWRFLERRVARTPDKTLLSYRETRQSYAAFHDDALAAARALHQIGVRAGDTVCLMLPNGPDYLSLWFGSARLGAVKVPINVHLKGDGLAYIIEHSEANVLVITADLLDRVLEQSGAMAALESVIVIGERDALPDRFQRWDDLLAESANRLLAATHDFAPEALHAILYTSGTTGPPKGVMLSHHAYLNSARAFSRQFVGATAEDILYTSLPLFHCNAQAHTVLPAIDLNATMAIGDRFSASGFWREIHDHGATIFNSLAAMIPILCKQPESPLDRAHSARLTACAATPTDVWLEFEARFGVRIIEGYGLTETAGFCVNNPRDAVRVGTIGLPMDFVEVRIADADGDPLPAGERGEILLRAEPSNAFMDGYFKQPDQTAVAMRGGWFHTGDTGYAGADGYLSFVDRMKQSIRRRGENISSWEVETIVNAHPLVLESAAVGVPSDVGEEEVKICIVARAGETIDPLEIVQWCEARMAYFMVPRYVEFHDALPKTPTERVEKYKLKQAGAGAAWDREAAGYRIDRR